MRVRIEEYPILWHPKFMMSDGDIDVELKFKFHSRYFQTKLNGENLLFAIKKKKRQNWIRKEINIVTLTELEKAMISFCWYVSL